MTLVDSSVWIDLFDDRQTVQVATLKALIIDEHPIRTGDLILLEILQGARGDAHARALRCELAQFECLTIGGELAAIAGAANYRLLRAKGIAVRKSIDTLIATRCILDDIPLLYSDRDFDPFVEHLGLRPTLANTGGY